MNQTIQIFLSSKGLSENVVDLLVDIKEIEYSDSKNVVYHEVALMPYGAFLKNEEDLKVRERMGGWAISDRCQADVKLTPG